MGYDADRGNQRCGLGEHGVGSADAHQVVGAEGSPHGGSAQIFVFILTQSGDRLHQKQTEVHTFCSVVSGLVVPSSSGEYNAWL